MFFYNAVSLNACHGQSTDAHASRTSPHVHSSRADTPMELTIDAVSDDGWPRLILFQLLICSPPAMIRRLQNIT